MAITKTWNGSNIDHRPVRLIFAQATGEIEIRVDAPFFNDPGNPGGQPGQPFDGLWDYEGNFMIYSHHIIHIHYQHTSTCTDK